MANIVMAYVVMANIVMAYVVMANIVMAYIVMAYVVMACVVMSCIVMACIVMAYIVMACIVMACIVMACIVMAYIVTAFIADDDGGALEKGSSATMQRPAGVRTTVPGKWPAWHENTTRGPEQTKRRRLKGRKPDERPRTATPTMAARSAARLKKGASENGSMRASASGWLGPPDAAASAKILGKFEKHRAANADASLAKAHLNASERRNGGIGGELGIDGSQGLTIGVWAITI